MRKRVRIIISFCIIFFFFGGGVKAQESPPFVPLNEEIVFLIDCSGSMKADKEGQAEDALLQILHSLPTDAKVGLVTYSSNIQSVSELGSNIDQISTMIKDMEYQGYSNAGLGLKQAVALFPESDKADRHIILFSDGEIDLRNKEEIDASVEQFREELKEAKEKGITLHVVDTGDGSQNNTFLFQEIVAGGDAVYSRNPEKPLSQVVEKLITQGLKNPWKAVGSMEGKNGSFHLSLSTTGISRAKILLVGGGKIQQVYADYQAKQGQLITGKYFVLLDVSEPLETVDISFELENGAAVKSWLLTEYEAQLEVDIQYRSEPEEKTEKQKSAYKKYADLEIRLFNGLDSMQNLWDRTELEGELITFWIDEEEYQGVIEQGVVYKTLLLEEEKVRQEAILTLSTEGLPEIYRGIQPLNLKIELPPEPVEEVDYRPLLIILSVLLLILLFLFLFWRKKESATLVYVAGADRSKKERYETRVCQYTGKFNLYVVQTKSGRDFAPQTILLFGRKSNRITLEWMLNSCSLKLGNLGAEDIAFYPGPDKAIIVMDQSEGCTVMRGMEILKKGMGYPVYYNEKLTITLEDGITELEIHYKNLKPSEREGQK